MFKVNIKTDEKDKTYFVYNSGELIETKALHTIYESFALDSQKHEVSYEIISNGNGLSIVLTHLEPVIISEEKVSEFLSFYKKYNKGDFLPCTPISQNEYDILFNYALYTNQLDDEFNEEEEIANDIECAKRYLKKK